MKSDNKIPFAERPVCTIRQAAEATGLGRSTIYQRIADQQLLTHKVGRRRLIVVKSLLALVGVPASGAMVPGDDITSNSNGGA